MNGIARRARGWHGEAGRASRLEHKVEVLRKVAQRCRRVELQRRGLLTVCASLLPEVPFDAEPSLSAAAASLVARASAKMRPVRCSMVELPEG